jgi:hypothetical protein
MARVPAVTARRFGAAVQPGRVLGEATWENVLADRREAAGREPLSTRSPVVGKSDVAATGVCRAQVITAAEWAAFTATGVRAEFD